MNKNPSRSNQPEPPTGEEPDSATRHMAMAARLLIALRNFRGLSLAEMGARAGISPASVLTMERGSLRTLYGNLLRVCFAAEVDHVTFFYEVSRRLHEAGTPPLPGKPPTSERAYIKERCDGYDTITPAEVRRQLRLLKNLTLPDQPAPPAKKRLRNSERGSEK